MKTCEYAGASLERRSHPWTDTAGDPDCRYYDLTAEPAHIRASLEDFCGWQRYPAVEAFYGLLERLNHPKSSLESNDCAFTGPGENADPSVRKALQCSGRLMVLFRSLVRNTDPTRIDALKHQLHVDLAAADPAFQWGIIGTTVVPVRYLALPEIQAARIAADDLVLGLGRLGNRHDAEPGPVVQEPFPSAAPCLRAPGLNANARFYR